MRRLCFIVTSPLGLNAFLRPHIEKLSTQYQISVCVSSDPEGVRPELPASVELHSIAIRRDISPVADLGSLIVLYKLLRRGKFDLVYTLSPKAGLLGMLAAWLARVPHRVHCFTGQVWATRTGLARGMLKTLDRLLAACATQLLADSASQRQFLIDQSVVAAGKIQVLGDGSMAGVDTQKFRPNPAVRDRLRAQLEMDTDDCCLLYVGRLKRDKGVLDLVEAFRRIQPDMPRLHLLLVGPDEEGLEPGFRGLPHLHYVGYTSAVADYMAAADVFCLPSYREGFGQVLIEAGAIGLPVVASRIYGITDAVQEGRTGLLHRAGNIEEMCDRLRQVSSDKPLRLALGQAGKANVLGRFSVDTVTAAMTVFVKQQFGS